MTKVAEGFALDAQTDEAEGYMAELGQRIRDLRLARQLGVRELARRIGVSPSLISHIELGKGAPSVKTLYALVTALEVPLSDLFVGGEAPFPDVLPPASNPERPLPQASSIESGFKGPVQRGGTRRAIQLEHGFRWERLTPDTDPEVEFMETVIAVGGGHPESEMKSHNGSEYGVVLQGKLGIKIAFDTYILEPRDSISFSSSTPHCMWNAGKEIVRSIWFVKGRSLL